MIRVLVADDHAIVRSGLTLLLASAKDLDVVGEASNGNEAVELVKELVPDVVLMDLSMPQLDGTEATRRIVATGLPTRVVALTSFSDQERITSTIDAGAAGYVLKDSAPDEIVRAVRAAAAGQSPLDPKAAQVLLLARSGAGRAGELTSRESEVLALLAEGWSNRKIASRLGITDATVKAHLTRVFQALGVTDRTQAALWAHKHGFASAGGAAGSSASTTGGSSETSAPETGPSRRNGRDAVEPRLLWQGSRRG
jgi:DNA-binding NarL/FixJ family response regulator